MGMAASQARLLTLTSRLHDIEYKAQNIESQKIALATQKDELYQAYCDALDATKIQVKFNDGAGTTYIDANFSTLCGYDENRASWYCLRDSKTGKVIVDEETAQIYDSYCNDKYSFAWAMMGFEGNFCWDGDSDGEFVGIGTNQAGDSTELENLAMTEVEQMVYDAHCESDPDLANAYADYEATLAEGSPAEQQEALNNFRDVLYSKPEYLTEIYDYMRLNKQDDKDKVIANGEYDDMYPAEIDTGANSEFNYYIRLFENIQASGGCQVIDAQYESGELGNEWFNNMVSSGRVLIDLYNATKNEWSETSVATSTNANNLQEVQDDTDLKKAEAEYEHELDVINTKDTKFDNDLSKLETERTAITTEIDSITQVRDDNIDRTFGIFS